MKNLILFLSLFCFLGAINLSAQNISTKQISADKELLSKLGVEISGGKAYYHQFEMGKDGKVKVIKAGIGFDAISLAKEKKNLANPIVSPRVVVCKNKNGAWTYYKKLEDFDDARRAQDVLNNLICVSFTLETKKGKCEISLWYEFLPEFFEKLNEENHQEIEQEINSPEPQEKEANYTVKNRESEINSLLVFPNPATRSNAKLKFNANAAGAAKVDIFNLQGLPIKTISNEFAYNTGENIAELNLEGVSAGMYLVVIGEGEKRAAARLLVN